MLNSSKFDYEFYTCIEIKYSSPPSPPEVIGLHPCTCTLPILLLITVSVKDCSLTRLLHDGDRVVQQHRDFTRHIILAGRPSKGPPKYINMYRLFI